MAKNAIITGGSRGIGKAMALKLGELGYNVAINYRSDSSKQLTEDLIEEIKSEYGVDAIAVQADVSKFKDCEKLVKATVDAFYEVVKTNPFKFTRSDDLAAFRQKSSQIKSRNGKIRYY